MGYVMNDGLCHDKLSHQNMIFYSLFFGKGKLLFDRDLPLVTDRIKNGCQSITIYG